MGANSSKKGSENPREATIPLPSRFPEDATSGKGRTGAATVIPTVVRWSAGPATSVKITGTFNNWDKHGIPLNKSGDEFYVILNLKKGDHEYKFLVDGKLTVDNTQPTVASPQGVLNVLTVTDDSILGNSMDQAADPAQLLSKDSSKIDEGYGQDDVVFEETRKFPPLCPPHLRYTPLNSSPQKRFFGDCPTVCSGLASSFRPSGDP
eukprot:RCo043246